MTSKTSFFEPAFFLRGLKKTFPVWFGYIMLWLLFLPLSIINQAQWDPTRDDIAERILSSAIASTVTAALLALALAWALFRFLFRNVTSYDIAALPVRRESLFLTNVLCGLSIALGAHLLIALLTLGASALIGLPAPGACAQYLAASMLCFVGFFGFAVLLAIIVGNAVAMPLIYIVLNFAAFVVVEIVAQLLGNFVYGLGSVSDGLLNVAMLLSPLTLIFGGQIRLVYGWNGDYTQHLNVTIGGIPYFYLIAAMGVISAVLAFFLMRRREMERSGDIIAIRALRPVFLYLFSIGCALVIGYVLSMFTSNTEYNFPLMLALQLAGAFLGYFAAQMMLQKSIRVFTGKRTWLGFLVLCLLLTGTFSAARFGLFGYSSKVPDARSVKAVSLRYTRVTDKADIEAIVALHQAIADAQDEQLALLQADPYNTSMVQLSYELQDGSTLRRRFEISGSSDLAYQTDALYNSPSFLVAREAIPGELTEKDFLGGAISGSDPDGNERYYSLSSKEAYELYTTCILPDLSESSIAVQHYITLPTEESDESAWTGYSVALDMSERWVPTTYDPDPNVERTISLNYWYDITADAARTVGYLKSLGFPVS